MECSISFVFGLTFVRIIEGLMKTATEEDFQANLGRCYVHCNHVAKLGVPPLILAG